MCWCSFKLERQGPFVINNKVGHLGHKHSTTTTFIAIINSIKMVMEAIKENVNLQNKIWKSGKVCPFLLMGYTINI